MLYIPARPDPNSLFQMMFLQTSLESVSTAAELPSSCLRKMLVFNQTILHAILTATVTFCYQNKRGRENIHLTLRNQGYRQTSNPCFRAALTVTMSLFIKICPTVLKIPCEDRSPDSNQRVQPKSPCLKFMLCFLPGPQVTCIFFVVPFHLLGTVPIPRWHAPSFLPGCKALFALTKPQMFLFTPLPQFVRGHLEV